MDPCVLTHQWGISCRPLLALSRKLLGDTQHIYPAPKIPHHKWDWVFIFLQPHFASQGNATIYTEKVISPPPPPPSLHSFTKGLEGWPGAGINMPPSKTGSRGTSSRRTVCFPVFWVALFPWNRKESMTYKVSPWKFNCLASTAHSI